MPTKTSSFGSGKREGHDASGFYRRFEPPIIDDDDTVLPPEPIAEPFVCGDARDMHRRTVLRHQAGKVTLAGQVGRQRHAVQRTMRAGEREADLFERDAHPTRLPCLETTAAAPRPAPPARFPCSSRGASR